jgi:hypothetical protein
MLSESRRRRNANHLPIGLVRQSVFGRIAGCEDVNDAERLSRDDNLVALAYPLANVMRTLALPQTVKRRLLTRVREKLVNICAEIVAHACHMTFRMTRSPRGTTCLSGFCG